MHAEVGDRGMHTLRSGKKVYTWRGWGQRYTHAEVWDRGMHMLRFGTEECTC